MLRGIRSNIRCIGQFVLRGRNPRRAIREWSAALLGTVLGLSIVFGVSATTGGFSSREAIGALSVLVLVFASFWVALLRIPLGSYRTRRFLALIVSAIGWITLSLFCAVFLWVYLLIE